MSGEGRKPHKLRIEIAARGMFEQYCREGIRPKMYDLEQTASGEYVSPFTEWAWKLYWKGINDAAGTPAACAFESSVWLSRAIMGLSNVETSSIQSTAVNNPPGGLGRGTPGDDRHHFSSGERYPPTSAEPTLGGVSRCARNNADSGTKEIVSTPAPGESAEEWLDGELWNFVHGTLLDMGLVNGKESTSELHQKLHRSMVQVCKVYASLASRSVPVTTEHAVNTTTLEQLEAIVIRLRSKVGFATDEEAEIFEDAVQDAYNIGCKAQVVGGVPGTPDCPKCHQPAAVGQHFCYNSVLNEAADSADQRGGVPGTVEEERKRLEIAEENLADYARRFFRLFDQYRNAWLREMGGVIRPKSWEIDGFVLRARDIYEKAKLVDRMKRLMVVKLKEKVTAEEMFDAVFKMLAEDRNDQIPTN